MALTQAQKDYFDAALDNVTSGTTIKTFFSDTKSPPGTVTPPGPRRTFVEGMTYLSQRTNLTSEQKEIIIDTLSTLARDADFIF